MNSRSLFRICLLMLAVISLRNSFAAELEFEIDSARSPLSLMGTLDESSLMSQDEAGESAMTSASGFFSMFVDNVIAPTEIAFEHTSIMLNHSGDWLPSLGGFTVEPPGPANFAMKFDDETGSGWGALRDFELTIFDTAVKNIDTTFDVPELLNIETGVLDFHAGLPFVGQINQAGTLLLNEAEDLARYELTENGAEITIPILIHSITTFDLTITGQFVATVDIPERQGDFDQDGQLTHADIDALSRTIRNGDTNLLWDLNTDGTVSIDDHSFWVNDKKRTYVGDANLDGEFNTADFVSVFQSAEYEDRIEGNSTWATGDWNADSDFDSTDFVVAFRTGAFEQGPRPLNHVPEPTNNCWLLMLLLFRRRRSLIFCNDLLK